MFIFKRKSTQPTRRRHGSSDLCVSAVLAGNEKHRCWQITFRISTSAMNKLGYLPNDQVVATCDMEKKLCSLTRVTDGSGNKISTRQGKKTNYGQVRFTCDKSDLEQLGLVKDNDNSNRIEASLIDRNGQTAVFAVVAE